MLLKIIYDEVTLRFPNSLIFPIENLAGLLSYHIHISLKSGGFLISSCSQATQLEINSNVNSNKKVLSNFQNCLEGFLKSSTIINLMRLGMNISTIHLENFIFEHYIDSIFSIT